MLVRVRVALRDRRGSLGQVTRAVGPAQGLATPVNVMPVLLAAVLGDHFDQGLVGVGEPVVSG